MLRQSERCLKSEWISLAQDGSAVLKDVKCDEVVGGSNVKCRTAKWRLQTCMNARHGGHEVSLESE